MRLDRLKSFALGLPQTTVIKQWSGLVFKVAGKVFIILSMDDALPGGISLKCAPAEFDALIARDGFVQAPYCAKRHWFRLEDLSLVPERELHALIRRSYDLVVAKLPKKIQATLAAEAVRALGLRPGMILSQTVEGNRLILEPLHDVDSLAGSLGTGRPAVSVAKMKLRARAAMARAGRKPLHRDR